MILGAFGDSFLFGSDLQDVDDHLKDSFESTFPSQLTWPALISKKLNLDYYCTAFPGQGNKIIADDVLRTIAHQGNQVFYVISWTWIDRFDYIGPDHPVTKDYGWFTSRPGSDDFNSKYYYKNFYNDADSKLTNLVYINTVIQELKKNNCQFLMTYLDSLLFDKHYHCTSSIDYLQNQVAPYMSLIHNKTFLEWSRQNQYPESQNWHPLEQAHNDAAEYWLKEVRTLLNNQAEENFIHAFI